MGYNLHRLVSNVNESLTKLFDELGVQRSFVVPYVDGQDSSEHVSTVSKTAARVGGLGKNFITTMHHSTGKGWGTGEGRTVGHPAHALRNTVIPKDDPNAKSVIDAAQKYLNAIASLMGDDEPTVKKAQAQLNLVKKTEGSGMNLLDFGTFIIHNMTMPTQSVARAHHLKKPGGANTSKLLPPHGQEPASTEAPPEQANAVVPPQANAAAPGAPVAAQQQPPQVAA